MTTNKSISIEISTSSNPAVAGEFFADMRDTSPGCGNRQMTTRTCDREPMRVFVSTVTSLAAAQDIAVTVIDTAGALA